MYIFLSQSPGSVPGHRHLWLTARVALGRPAVALAFPLGPALSYGGPPSSRVNPDLQRARHLRAAFSLAPGVAAEAYATGMWPSSPRPRRKAFGDFQCDIFMLGVLTSSWARGG